MNAQQFKKLREKFELTQDELAVCLGVTQKAVSHYETGFRSPGPTINVVMKTLDSLPLAQANKILSLMKEISETLKSDKKRKFS